jgi:hypothetical protein
MSRSEIADLVRQHIAELGSQTRAAPQLVVERRQPKRVILKPEYSSDEDAPREPPAPRASRARAAAPAAHQHSQHSYDQILAGLFSSVV